MILPRNYGIFGAMTNEFHSSAWIPGQTVILYQCPKKKTSRINRIIGLFLLSIPLAFLLNIYLPVAYIELVYRLNQTGYTVPLQTAAEPKISRFGEMLFLNQRGINSPANYNFSLIITKIGINAPIVLNVDPGDETQYREALRSGIAHAKNTATPDNKGTIYLFGHSSNYLWDKGLYNQIFYLLPKLEKGDEIILVYQGVNYAYEVKEKKVAETNDLSYLLNSGNDNRLVLQTCWPPGTDWKRYVVIALPKGASL